MSGGFLALVVDKFRDLSVFDKATVGTGVTNVSIFNKVGFNRFLNFLIKEFLQKFLNIRLIFF